MEPPRRPRDSERRYATVLFADISGFTSMSERLDPEEVTDIINQCLSMLAAVVDAHGGHVDKYIGDCIMALFGVPRALEHAPQQAINAAIEMRGGLVRLIEERRLQVALDVHIGINTGLVVAGNIGGEVKQEFTVVGDAVNLASRLKDLAPNKCIYVGAETHRYVREQFEFRRLAPLTVKGKKQPVDAYELLSDRERVHRMKPSGVERMISSALVGRDAELRLLGACIAAVGRGEGGIVHLIGEAGLGKSRLLAEACAAEPARAVTWLEGRSLAIGQAMKFHPFVDLLSRWAAIGDDDREQDSQPKLAAAVAALFPEEHAEIFPFVATLMGMRLDGAAAERLAGITGESLEKLVLKSVRELFQRLAAARPLVVVFEDLHWADQSSIQLLEALLRLVQDSPVLFILVFRPDHQDTSQRILEAARRHHAERQIELNLEPLDERQCSALIRNLLRAEDLPYSALRLISKTAEGNPFYIEEVVRSLIEEGVVESVRGRLTLTERIETVVIPGTIQGVIMARFDRLPEPTRQLLQVASVIGRNFYLRLLARLMPEGFDLDGQLAYLKERQLLLERKTRRTSIVRRQTLAEEVEYVFKHALTQETIYESILQKTRKELHRRVAEAIEAIFADRLPDFFAMLAYHFSRADSLEKAEDYLFRAGAEAARAAASSEALHFFQEASRLYLLMHGEGGDPAKKCLLEKSIGLALLNKGGLLESIDHFDDAIGFLGERVPRGTVAFARRLAVDMLVLLARLYLNRVSGTARPTDREEFEIRYNRARAQTTSDPKRFVFDTIRTIRRMTETDPTVIDQACGMYTAAATVFIWSGISFAIAKRLLAVARGLIREGNLRDEFGYRSWKFVLHYLEGDWSEEHLLPEEMVEQALRHGQFWDVNTYLGLECERRIHQGDFAGARRDIERIARVRDVYGFDFARSNEYAMPAYLFLEERRLGEALRAVDRYHADRHEELLHLIALGTRAKIQILAGDARATETFARADALRKRLGPVPGYHLIMLLVSRFLADLNALETAARAGDRGGRRAAARRARRSGRAAVRVARSVAYEKMEVYRLMGRLAWLLGKRERAVRWWERSLRAGTRMGARPELARTCFEIGRRLTEAGEADREVVGMRPAGYLERAERLCAELGLDWHVEQEAYHCQARPGEALRAAVGAAF
jgi:class 3 adenylate cyclase